MRVRVLGATATVFAASLFAQTAQFTGRITDPSQAIIPGAEISVTSADTGITREAKSNAEGYFTIPLLPSGTYTIASRAAGFNAVTRSGIALNEGQVLRYDIKMDVGQVTEAIEVSGGAPLLEAATSALSTVVPNQRILDMPLNGRNPIALSTLVPGVRTMGPFGVTPVSAYDGSRMSISGAPPSSNSFMVDGIAAENMTSGGIQLSLSTDATEEFRIITKNPSAEYGRTGGGVVNLISKSGTNEYHGAAWEFLRNKALNANDFFSNRAGKDRAPLTFNQYGATFGGPVRKHKTFFFANWEGVEQRTLSTSTRTVPTDLQKQGNFSQTKTASGAQVNIYDPYSTKPDPNNAGKRIRDPFPGNAIPAARLNPVALAMMKYYPDANQPGVVNTQANNFFGQASAALSKNLWGIKVDQYFTETKRLAARFTRDKTFRGTPAFFGIAENGSDDKYFPRLSGVVNYTDAIRPDLLLELRIGVNRYAPNSPMRTYGFDVSKLGLPAVLNTQTQFMLMPEFLPSDVYAIGGNQGGYTKQANTTWNWGGSLTKIAGAHNFKLGAEERMYTLNNTQGGPIMTFSFSRGFTQGSDPNVAASTSGYGLATMLLGTPSSGSARRWQPFTYLLHNYGAYLQDDWKISPKLTLNLGVRWEFEGGLTDRYDAISNFDPAIQTNVQGVTLVGGLVYPGKDGLSRGNRNNSFLDFDPRIGFAYQLSPKTVVRGGFGTYHLPSTGDFVSLGQTGFGLTTSMITSSDGFVPYDTLTNPFPSGIQSPPGSNLGTLTGLGTSVEGNLRSLQRGYTEQWNVNVQHQLPGAWLMEVGYAATHGVSLPANRTYDYVPNSARALGTKLQDQVANPYAKLISTGSLSLANVTRGTLLDTYPQFLGASGLDSWANSNYHSLTVRVEKRFAHGLSTLLGYTFSKLIDDNLGNGSNGFNDTGSNSVQNWEDLRSERAVSAINLPHRLVLSNSWVVPVGKTGPVAYRKIAGDWQLNSILTMQSGSPIGITATSPAYGGNRPNVVGDPNLNNPTIDKWFNTAAFAAIAPFTFGNAPRNLPSTRTDSLFNWDLSVVKSFLITERFRLQFRAEAFNVTNTPTFGSPGTTFGSGSFGVVSSLATNTQPRQGQLALKLYF
jgi:hypothetical protein